MSRCPYCDRELPGFETLCQQCFEAGCDRVVHPKPWWQRLRPTRDSLYAFLFVFGYVYLLGRIDRDHQPGTAALAILAFLLAAFIVVVGRATRDQGEPKVTPRHTAFGFFVLFAIFVFRLWVRSKSSKYLPFDSPALFALVFAVIGAFAASFPKDAVKVEGQAKKERRKTRRP